jgi:hypothetical protein
VGDLYLTDEEIEGGLSLGSCIHIIWDIYIQIRTLDLEHVPLENTNFVSMVPQIPPLNKCPVAYHSRISGLLRGSALTFLVFISCRY